MKKIIIICICSTLLMSSGCQKYDKKPDKVTNQGETIDCDYSLQTLDEIRATKDDIIKQAQEGRWSNLKFDEFDPYISDVDEIYEVLITKPEKYKGLEREELLDEQLKVIENYFSDTSKGVFGDYWGVIENGKYTDTVIDSLREEMRDETNTGDYVDNPIINYKEYSVDSDKTGHVHKLISVDSSFLNIDLDCAKIKNVWIDEQVKVKGSLDVIVPGLSIWFCEMTDYAYRGDTDGILDKKYKLLNGEMSIREGIEFVENYVNNELPYETNPNIKASVYGVDVMKVTDDVYAFHFRMRREIYGLVTEAGWPVMTGQSAFYAEMATVEMIETDKIDVMYCQQLTADVEKTSEAITEIISLEAAIDMVSKEIGVNSSYIVEDVELAYDKKGVEGKAKGIPVWRFTVNNEKSEYSMIFSVDVLTGKVKYREL